MIFNIENKNYAKIQNFMQINWNSLSLQALIIYNYEGFL